MKPDRQKLIAKIDALAEECDAAEEPEAGSVLRAITAAMFAQQERGLMEHVKQFSWRLLKQIVASRN
jgi:hypothetical protein